MKKSAWLLLLLTALVLKLGRLDIQPGSKSDIQLATDYAKRHYCTASELTTTWYLTTFSLSSWLHR